MLGRSDQMHRCGFAMYTHACMPVDASMLGYACVRVHARAPHSSTIAEHAGHVRPGSVWSQCLFPAKHPRTLSFRHFQHTRPFPRRRKDLSYECKATLFDQEVRMAESIDFQYPMKKACNEAITRFCKDVPRGRARVMRCLQDNLDNPAMPPACKAEVGNSTARSSQDYR